MTVIAWDGKTLAADRQSQCGDGIIAVTKIFRVANCLVGITGDLTTGLEMKEWLRNTDPALFRQEWRNPDAGAGMLVIYPDGTAWKYESSPTPFPLEGPFAAAGSGASHALVAMDCGSTARQAVLLVQRYINSCGMGCDLLDLNGDPTS